MISITNLRIIATTVHGVAEICTFLRLAYQIRQRRFWLDDGAATFAALASIVWLAGFWAETDIEGVGPLVLPLAQRVNAYWAESLTFLIIVWFTRASVLLSIVRIAPPGLISRKIPFFAVVVFAAMWIALMAQRITLCYRDKSWASDETPQCSTSTLKITSLALEFFSDIVLLCAPLGALVFGRTTSNQSRLLIVTFIASFVLTAVSVGHGVTTIHDFSNHFNDLAAIVQSGASLLLTNLTITIVVVHQAFNPQVVYPDEYAGSHGVDKQPLKGMISHPRAMASVHLKMDGSHNSFSTSSPHRFFQKDANNFSESISHIPVEEKARHSFSADSGDGVVVRPMYMPDPDPGSPYGVVEVDNAKLAPWNKKLFRPTSGLSSVSAYSYDSARSGTPDSTRPMVKESNSSLDTLAPLPPAGLKNVHFLSPVKDTTSRLTMQSTYSSIVNGYMVEEDPFQKSGSPLGPWKR